MSIALRSEHHRSDRQTIEPNVGALAETVIAGPIPMI
jgi:hypothetical protein